MEIKIPCRNAVTGEALEFDTLQEVANHLAAQEHPGDWTGFEPFGQLPEPSEGVDNTEDEETASQTGLVGKLKAAAKKVAKKS